MNEQQYIDVLEAAFISFLIRNFDSEVSGDTALRLLEILESKMECGYSAQDVTEYLIKRNSGEN